MRMWFRIVMMTWDGCSALMTTTRSWSNISTTKPLKHFGINHIGGNHIIPFALIIVRFISVEMAYFSRWWNEATDQQREQCKQLVNNSQFEFVIGGWTMEDEACTTYRSSEDFSVQLYNNNNSSTNIDQMTEGHRFIFDNFGVTPRF